MDRFDRWLFFVLIPASVLATVALVAALNAQGLMLMQLALPGSLRARRLERASVKR
jgi:hypothetical protein